MNLDLSLDLPKTPICRFKRVVQLMAMGQRSTVIQRVERVQLNTVFAEAWELNALYKSIDIHEQLDLAAPELVVGVRLQLIGSQETQTFYDLETGHHNAVASYLFGDSEIDLMVRTEYLLPVRDYLIVGTRLFHRDHLKRLKPLSELDHDDVIMLKELGVECRELLQFQLSLAWSTAQNWITGRMTAALH